MPPAVVRRAHPRFALALERRSLRKSSSTAAGRDHELASVWRRDLSYRVYAARQPIICRCSESLLAPFNLETKCRDQSANLFDLIAARAPHLDKLALETQDADRANLWRVV